MSTRSIKLTYLNQGWDTHSVMFVNLAALVYHVPQFMEKYGNISIFNCQPVEKKNHEQSRMFHRGTQKGGRHAKYTCQVMEKENRKIFARVHDLFLIKRGYNKKENVEEDSGSLTTYSTNSEEG